jgi:flagellar protein FliO/FliZ
MDSISFFWSFFKMLSALALVIAMMIGAMVLIKKFFYQSPSAANGNAMIDIISTCHLGPKNSFMLIEVLGQVLLVGVSNHEMSVLATITQPEAIDKLRNLRLHKGFSAASDPFSRYRSLFRNLGRMRKDR